MIILECRTQLGRIHERLENAGVSVDVVYCIDTIRRMLLRTYSNAISAYQGQQMKVLPLHMKAGETDVAVRNQYIKPGQKPVQVDYQMHKVGNDWKIYDIIVEGVSLVLTYRSEFDQVVKESGVDGLIKRIAAKNEPAAVGSSSPKK